MEEDVYARSHKLTRGPRVCAARGNNALMWLIAFAITMVPLKPAAANAVTDVKPSVVRIVVVSQDDSGDAVTGTGFKIGSGLFVTNRHVVARALSGGYVVWIVPWGTGATPVKARIRASADADLALLQSDDIDTQPLALATLPPEAGQTVMALGYPGQVETVLGHDRLAAPSPPDVTVGALINSGESSLENGAKITELVHSASIWPGNSGGPLIDQCGRVVGVNTWIHAEQGLAQQNIAVSAQDVISFLNDNNAEPRIDSGPCNGAALESRSNVAPDQSTAEDGDSAWIGWLLLGTVSAIGIFGIGWTVERRRRAEIASRQQTQDIDEW